MISLAQQVATGAAWMVAFRIGDRLVGIISVSVLARFLLPEHFGVVALASSLAGLMAAMSEFGVDLALIRDQASDRRLYDTAWTIRLLRSAALGVVLVVAARPMAALFREARLEAVVYCLAVAGILEAAENIGVVEFRKSLAFDKDFKYLLLSRCLAAPAAIAMAVAWRSHWALVGGVLAQAIVRLFVSYGVHDYRPRLSLAGASHLMSFSAWTALQHLVHGLNTRAPTFVLGRLSHVTALAHFDVAYEMATMATTELRAPVRRALFPGFARLAGDATRLTKGYIDSYGVLVLLGLPVPVMMSVVAPLLVRVFLGEHWLPAVPVIRILAVFGVIQALSPSSHLIYLALNRVAITAMLSALQLTLLVPLLLFGVAEFGAVGAAWAVNITAATVVLVDALIITRVLCLRPLELCAGAVRPVVAATGMFLALRGLMAVASHETLPGQMMWLVALSAAGLLSYTALLLGLWALGGWPDAAERRVLTMLGGWWRQFSARRSRFAEPPATSSGSLQRAVIVFGGNEWDGIWQTRQHISSRLALQGWRVAYTTGQLFLHERRSAEWKARPLFTERLTRDDVTIVRSGRLLVRWPKLPWWDRSTLRRHAEELMAAVGWHDATHRVAYVYHPNFWPYLACLTDCVVVYHVDDAFALFPGATAESLAMETLLVDRADLLLASSQAMVRLLPSGGPRKAKLLPNAADAALFMAADREPCPADLRIIPRPRIGYTGAINLKVNLSLVRELASRRPEWNWVFVGPVREMAPPGVAESRAYTGALAACRSLRNVHFLGPKTVQEVPAYVAHMDVNAMCYRTDPGGWWTALYPLKLHEYLAAGRPVVAANLETLREFSSVLTIAETVDDWVLAIETALATDNPVKKHARQAVALQNTWDHRIDQLVGWLQQAENP